MCHFSGINSIFTSVKKILKKKNLYLKILCKITNWGIGIRKVRIVRWEIKMNQLYCKIKQNRITVRDESDINMERGNVGIKQTETKRTNPQKGKGIKENTQSTIQWGRKDGKLGVSELTPELQVQPSHGAGRFEK